MEPYDHDPHYNVKTFSSSILPVPVMYDDAVSGRQQEETLPRRQPVEVTLVIRYRKTLTYSYKDSVRGQITIFDQSQYKREKRTIQLLLSDLIKSFSHSSALLCPELLNLGIEPGHHKGVIEKIMRCAKEVEEKIEAEKNDRRAVLVPITMDVSLSIVKWVCLECIQEREKIWFIREMLEGCRVSNCEKETSCAICLEDFGVGIREKYAVRMPCSHEFHEECLLKWLLKTPSCPLCRVDINY